MFCRLCYIHNIALQNYIKFLNYARAGTKKNDPKAVFCVYRCAVGRVIATLLGSLSLRCLYKPRSNTLLTASKKQ